MDVCVNIYRYLSGGLKTRRKDELQLESTWGAENKDKNIALIFGEKRLSRKSLHKENSHFMVCNILWQFLLKSTILFSQGNTDYKIALWKAWGIFMRSCSPQAENRSCEPRNEEKKKITAFHKLLGFLIHIVMGFYRLLLPRRGRHGEAAKRSRWWGEHLDSR